MSSAGPPNSPTPTTILLADDHPALRIGVRVLLDQAPDLVVVGEAGDGGRALELIAARRPAVTLLDCQLPGLTGAAVAAEVQRQGLPTRILAFSAYRDERYVREMLRAGAVGYLLKEEIPEVLLSAVRAVGRGEGWFSPAVAAWVAGFARPAPTTAARLTDRELAVLRLVTQGKTNKEIAASLTVAERTVEFHLSNVLAKLGVDSRVKAAVWAKEHGVET